MTKQSHFTLEQVFEQLNEFKDKKRAHHTMRSFFMPIYRMT